MDKTEFYTLGREGLLLLSSYCILLIFHWYSSTSAVADDTSVTFGTTIFQLCWHTNAAEAIAKKLCTCISELESCCVTEAAFT